MYWYSWAEGAAIPPPALYSQIGRDLGAPCGQLGIMPSFTEHLRRFLQAEGAEPMVPLEERLKLLEEQVGQLGARQEGIVPVVSQPPVRTRYRLPQVDRVAGRDRVELSARVPREYRDLLRKIAEAEGRSVNSVLADLLRDGLEAALDRDPSAAARSLPAGDQDDSVEEPSEASEGR